MTIENMFLMDEDAGMFYAGEDTVLGKVFLVAFLMGAQ